MRARAHGFRLDGGRLGAIQTTDGDLPADVLAKVRALPQVQQAMPLKF